MKYKIGDAVTNRSVYGDDRICEVIQINTKKKYPYLLKVLGRASTWHPENELKKIGEFQDGTFIKVYNQ